MDATAQLAELNRKMDRMATILEAQERRQAELEELKKDLVPIANQAVKLSIDELAEIGTEFQVEDLLYLLKRLLRSTDLLLRMLDQMEALSSLGDEAELIGKQVFSQAVQTLDDLEQKGYFSFAQSGWYVLEKIVEEFDEEDVMALGDNVVLILKTMRNLTQPDIMTLTNRAVEAIRPGSIEEPEMVSLWQLLSQLRDPRVRRGTARMLQLVKSLAEPLDKEPGTNGN
jgi:uncharacterized protein YjgD (DUF1641 family)